MHKEFEDFINSKPADSVIDNNHAWCRCAVGEYADHLDRDIDEVVQELWQSYGSFDYSIAEQFEATYTNEITLMDDLNHSRFNNYGELQDFINQGK